MHKPANQRGIIPRSFEHIFEAIDASENMKYLVHASYLEIYNEEIRDLLGTDITRKLQVKEHPDKGVYVSGMDWMSDQGIARIVINVTFYVSGKGRISGYCTNCN